MSAPRHGEHDRELSALYRQAPRIEPRTAVDDAILAAARRPAASRRRSARAFAPRHRALVSVAAMLLVAVVLAPALYERTSWPPAPNSDAEPSALREAAPRLPVRAAPGAGLDDAAPAATPKLEAASGSAPRTPRLEARSAPAPAAADRAPEPAVMPAPATEERMQRSRRAAAPDPSPVQLLEQIETLLQAGNLEAARVVMETLRERYPQYPVDDALQRRLDSP